MGSNVVRDFMAGITDIIGGRSGAYASNMMMCIATGTAVKVR